MSGKGNKPLTYKQKSGISFIAQDDPPFIKEMKKKMGYKEPAKLEDKFNDDGVGISDDVETELQRAEDRDDLPQIVVLNPETDLTQDDVKKALEARLKEEDEQKIADGKIVFKKPTKRLATSKNEIEEKKKKDVPLEELKPQGRLLSFGDEEEEE